MGKIEGWKYYNHAAVPNCAPHEIVDTSAIDNGSIWKMDGKPLLVRWIEDYDCGYETNWWYIVQDELFDIMSLSSKSRRRITCGLKRFDCRRIDPKEYAEEMADITLKDWDTYPIQYRPHATREQLVNNFKNWELITHGAFDREDGSLSAFHGIEDNGTYFTMIQGKSLPEKQKGYVNAALIYTYIRDIGESYKNGKYLTNGQRNLNHQTNFNEDLCKYYGFRKAYCKLRIAYNPKIKWIIKMAFPFRRILMKWDRLSLVHNLNVILKMEEITRQTNNFNVGEMLPVKNKSNDDKVLK